MKWTELKSRVEEELAQRGLADAVIGTLDVTLPRFVIIRVKDGLLSIESDD